MPLNEHLNKDNDISVLLADKEMEKHLSKSNRLNRFTSSKDIDVNHSNNIFVIANALNLGEVANFVRQANDVKRLRGLLIRQDTYQTWTTQLLDRARLRTLKNTIVYSGWDVPLRILKAWQYDAQNELIADAAILDNQLFVLDCALHRYEIRFDQIKALAKIPTSQRKGFSISSEGSYISWEKYDVDIDLDTIRTIVNPVFADQAKLKKLKHDRCFGAAIALLRKKLQLKQTEIPGLTDRQVRRIEAGEHATTKSLELLAAAHKMKLNQYLNQLGECIHKLDK